jgi:hypothetical protein
VLPLRPSVDTEVLSVRICPKCKSALRHAAAGEEEKGRLMGRRPACTGARGRQPRQPLAESHRAEWCLRIWRLTCGFRSASPGRSAQQDRAQDHRPGFNQTPICAALPPTPSGYQRRGSGIGDGRAWRWPRRCSSRPRFVMWHAPNKRPRPSGRVRVSTPRQAANSPGIARRPAVGALVVPAENQRPEGPSTNSRPNTRKRKPCP